MKMLAEFLARHICKSTNFNQIFFEELIAEGLEAYKQHLQNDNPKTVQWAMIEKNLISALEKMQSENHLCENADFCEEKGLNDCGCRPIGSSCIHSSCIHKVKHPICPLNLYFEGDEGKIDLNKCDFEDRHCSNACDENSIRRL